MKGLWKVLKIVGPLGLAIYLMWKTFKDPEQRSSLFEAIAQANYWWVFLSMVLAMASHFVRARRWEYLLSPLGYQTRFWNRYHSTMIGYFVNMLLPRVGEVARPEFFRRHEKIAFDKTLGTIAAERVVDLMAFGVLVLTALLTQYDLIRTAIEESLAARPAAQPGGIPWFWIAVAAGLVIGVVLVIKLKLIDKVKGFISGILDGVMTVWTTKSKWAFFRDTVLIWVLYLLMYAACFQCFDVTGTLGLNAQLMGFIFGTLAVILTPGGTGAYHLAFAFALGYYGLDDNTGQALGLILWGSQMLLYILLGLLSLLLIGPYNKAYQGHASQAD
jgi:uncharacterized membrane protein YbhN (UPF0104 family)